MSGDPLRARREYAANAILEDERLRGDLTDDQFAPIQADALKQVDQAALATKGQTDDAARQAIDATVQSAKDAVRQRVAALATPVLSTPPTLVARFLSRLRPHP